MVPLILAESVWQSMDSTLSCVSMMLLFGGLLLLIMVQAANSKLGKILNNLRLTNELLKKISEKTETQPPPVPPHSPSSGQASAYKID